MQILHPDKKKCEWYLCSRRRIGHLFKFIWGLFSIFLSRPRKKSNFQQVHANAISKIKGDTDKCTSLENKFLEIN